MKENIKKTKNMDMEYLFGLQEIHIKVNIRMMSVRARVK